jgi:NADH dehydrogenase
MILVTGGTGFIGKALLRNLVESGYPVRALIRPSPRSPELPHGVPLEVAVSSLSDERSLRAAMVGVKAVYHLAGVERRGAYADLMSVDIQGTRLVAEAAADAGVQRIFFLSHLGADRASAYPVLKAKAIAEEYVRRSRVPFTILRTAIVYGPNDGFTTTLARLFSVLPYFFLIPGDGRTLIQPLWVEDLVTCLTWALEDDATRDHTFELGGPEYFTFLQVAEMVMHACNSPRRMLPVRPPYLRGLTVLLEAVFPGLPVSVYWLDYLAANRTCALDTLPRLFHLMPARMSQRLGYLRGEDWRRSMLQALLRRPAR